MGRSKNVHLGDGEGETTPRTATLGGAEQCHLRQ